MELLTHNIGEQKVAVVWHHFLKEHPFGDIDEAWVRFEEWLHNAMADIKKLTGAK